MKYEKQPQTKYGFTDMYGHEWCDAWVDMYNLLTDKINKSAGIEVYQGSLIHTEREFYLDQRHKTYIMFANTKRELNQPRLLS